MNNNYSFQKLKLSQIEEINIIYLEETIEVLKVKLKESEYNEKLNIQILNDFQVKFTFLENENKRLYEVNTRLNERVIELEKGNEYQNNRYQYTYTNEGNICIMSTYRSNEYEEGFNDNYINNNNTNTNTNSNIQHDNNKKRDNNQNQNEEYNRLNIELNEILIKYNQIKNKYNKYKEDKRISEEFIYKLQERIFSIEEDYSEIAYSLKTKNERIVELEKRIKLIKKCFYDNKKYIINRVDEYYEEIKDDICDDNHIAKEIFKRILIYISQIELKHY